MKAYKYTLLGLFVAFAIVLSIVEGLIPSFGIPGIKLGLANIVILVVLYEFGWKEALVVDILRIYLAALLRGTIFQMGFVMSLTGGLISLLIMIILKGIFKDKLSVIFVSIIGAILHSLGQILIGILYLGSVSVIAYLPILLVVSICTGFLIGILAKILMKTGVIKRYKNRYDL